MNWFDDFNECVRARASLAPFTWFKIGGPARWLAEPRDEAQLAGLVRRCRDTGVQTRLLGRGANLLVCDDEVNALVIRLTGPAFEDVNEPNDGTLRVGAGADLMHLVKNAAKQGRAGLEALAGIPATLGGAVRMNCGGKHGEIGPLVISTRTMTRDGAIRDRRDLRFQYRRAMLDEGEIVLGAILKLTPADPAATYERYREIWLEKTSSQPGLKEQSAGCIFKNPPGGRAGMMIDQAGLKNFAVGRAKVSPVHANFIVAEEGATARDVLELIAQVQERVAQRFGVMLETEVEVWRGGGASPASAPVRLRCEREAALTAV